MKKIATFSALAAALLMLTPVAWSHDAGDWYVRVGFTNVDPDDPNGDIDLGVIDPALPVADINVDDAWSLTFTGSWQWTDNWAVELLAAVPFEHDIKVDGLGKVGKTKHLPPTLSLQYHFLPKATIQPYVGAGVNYTLFFDDEEDGTLKDLGGSLSIEDNSFGIAGQIGADWILNDNWFLNVDLRYIAIDTEAEVTIPDVGTIKEDVDIDPWVYGINVGYKF
jgi:outer membrane protein